MIAIYKQRGDSIDYIPASDISAGDVVVIGDLVGIAKLDIEAGKLGAIALTGVYDIAKASGSGTGIPAGIKVYWDDVTKVVTTDDNSGSNKYLGKTIADASNDDLTVLVRLSQ